jgi:hypothetical protein
MRSRRWPANGSLFRLLGPALIMALGLALVLAGCGADELVSPAAAEDASTGTGREQPAEPPPPDPTCEPHPGGDRPFDWDCSSTFSEDFDGDLCDALVAGTPSVHDYVTSLHDGREGGFLLLAGREDRLRLLARFAQVDHVELATLRHVDAHDVVLRQAIDELTSPLRDVVSALDDPDRAPPQLAESVASYVEAYDRSCATRWLAELQGSD